MEFKEMLQNLKHSKRYNSTLLTKEVIGNVRHINKTELFNMLEILHSTSDMEYQVKLVTILTAYLLFNNSNRDVIIKSTFLYRTLHTILTRGLPRKTAITLNFITSLLYAEDDGESRSRTLTLHAQNLIRNSGCLAAMCQLFMNSMVHTETLQALCRCLAEVCRGSEPNQSCCSHMVPLCVQRCLQGNLDVFPVLQSLLFNHKRNTNLFMEADGASIFHREYVLRQEACLQLLNVVIQNADDEAIRIISSGVLDYLQDSLKMDSGNINIVRWTKIVLYYLDSKLKGNYKCFTATKTKLKQNTMHMDSNVDDTQILLQNIMSEIISYPSQTHPPVQSNHSGELPDKLTHIPNILRGIKDTKSQRYNKKNSENKQALRNNFNVVPDEKLSFSFLIDDNRNAVNYSNSNDVIHNNNQKHKVQQSALDKKDFTQSREIPEYESSNFCDTFKAFNNESENISDFKPTFVSTPKRLPNKMHSTPKNTSTTRSFVGLSNNRVIRDRSVIKKPPKKTISKEKHEIKNRSMSSRFFDAINESCTTILRSVKNVFTGNKHVSKEDTTNMKFIKNDIQKSVCSYSFTKYMHQRESELVAHETENDDSSLLTPPNTVNICSTCDDTLLLQQKFVRDEQLKCTVKKLKLGINLYGCDFKRISKTLWPRDTYMTPTVLYNLYRKLLLK